MLYYRGQSIIHIKDTVMYFNNFFFTPVLCPGELSLTNYRLKGRRDTHEYQGHAQLWHILLTFPSIPIFVLSCTVQMHWQVGLKTTHASNLSYLACRVQLVKRKRQQYEHNNTFTIINHKNKTINITQREEQRTKLLMECPTKIVLFFYLSTNHATSDVQPRH